jgi:hypothetical protein
VALYGLQVQITKTLFLQANWDTKRNNLITSTLGQIN